MRLGELVRDMEGVTGMQGDPSIELSDLFHDSRKVVPGSLFFAVPGEHADGAGFVPDALARGAVAVVAARAR